MSGCTSEVGSLTAELLVPTDVWCCFEWISGWRVRFVTNSELLC